MCNRLKRSLITSAYVAVNVAWRSLVLCLMGTNWNECKRSYHLYRLEYLLSNQSLFHVLNSPTFEMKTNLWVQICKFFCPSEFKSWERAQTHIKLYLALISSLITASATNCGSWYTTLRSEFQIDHKLLLWYHTFIYFNGGTDILLEC